MQPRPLQIPGTQFNVHWSKPLSLAQVKSAPPASLAHRGKQRVYAIYRKGTTEPVYVGHVHGDKTSVLRRLLTHMSPVVRLRDQRGKSRNASATRKLNRLLSHKNIDLNNYSVQVGAYQAPGYQRTPNMTRVIEGLLQQMMQPKYWDPKVTTFEEEDGDEDG
jgi:hypothetical protein